MSNDQPATPQPPSPVKGALAAAVASVLAVLVLLGIISTETAAAWSQSVEPWLNVGALLLTLVVPFLPSVSALWKKK